MRTKAIFGMVFWIMTSTTAFAQFELNDRAPVNKVGLKYHKAHFNLKGPVQSYKDSYTTYYFDNSGYLIKDESTLGLKREYSYDSNRNLTKIYSDLYGSIITYDVTLDRGKRVLTKKTTSNSGSRFVYDNRGNLLEEYDTYNNQIKYRHAYDNQNRLIRTEGFYQAINETSLTTYSYRNDGDFVLVTNSYSSSNPDRKSTTNTFYYKDGHYYGKQKTSNVNFDTYGNPLHYVNADGSKSSDKVYSYFVGNNTSNSATVSKPSSPNTVSTPSAPSSTTTACVSGDCSNGWGKKNFSYGYYEGFWKNGKRHGYGLFQWDGSGKYIGFWYNDELDGYGCYLGTDKNLIGEYRNGSMNGVGYTHELKTDKWVRGRFENYLVKDEYTFYDNKITTGCIAGDCNNKYGRYKWSNGDQFTGFFKNGKMFMGTYLFASGDKYEGKFNSNNQFHGEGRFFFEDGAYYGGEWNSGKYSGRGYYHDSSYTQKIGEWRNGEFIKSL